MHPSGPRDEPLEPPATARGPDFLPAHRVAVQAGLAAAIGGLGGGLLLCGLVLDDVAHDLRLLPALLAGSAAWCALVTITDQLARRSGRVARAALVPAMGAVAAFVSVIAMLWARGVAGGRAPDVGLLASVFHALSRPMPQATAIIVGVGLWAAASSVAWTRSSGARVVAQLGAAALGGLVSWLFLRLSFGRRADTTFFWVFTLVPAAGAAALVLAERLERWSAAPRAAARATRDGSGA